GAGAFIGLALFARWIARGSLLAAWRDALRGAPRQPGELMSYRLAYGGVLLGVPGAALLWAHWGLDLRVALIFFALYFLFQLTVARIVVEAGAGWHFAPACNPHQLLFSTLGMREFGPRGL